MWRPRSRDTHSFFWGTCCEGVAGDSLQPLDLQICCRVYAEPMLPPGGCSCPVTERTNWD